MINEIILGEMAESNENIKAKRDATTIGLFLPYLSPIYFICVKC